MSTAKSLSEDQISTIRSWADSGDGLSDIQRRLAEDLDIRVTYLETRFLLEDLGIELLPEPEPESEAPEEGAGEPTAPEEPGEADAELVDEEGKPVGEPADVSVTVDQVQRPGAIVSGKATFSGGKTASWWLDQMGRLGMDADDPSFKPSEQELMAFQRELQNAVRGSGI